MSDDAHADDTGEPASDRSAELAMELATKLTDVEHAYRTAVMSLVGRADDVAPLARVAEHLANMCAAVGQAAGAALERVDLFDQLAAAGYAAQHDAGYTGDTEIGEDGENGGDGGAERAPWNLGEASMHLEHLKALMEAAETMGGHATAVARGLHARVGDAVGCGQQRMVRDVVAGPGGGAILGGDFQPGKVAGQPAGQGLRASGVQVAAAVGDQVDARVFRAGLEGHPHCPFLQHPRRGAASAGRAAHPRAAGPAVSPHAGDDADVVQVGHGGVGGHPPIRLIQSRHVQPHRTEPLQHVPHRRPHPHFSCLISGWAGVRVRGIGAMACRKQKGRQMRGPVV